ncbi:MAG: ABC transporter permease subunit [Chthonomonadetes bacterium]|nr:ABC transporter permease subunit [Chthonomonadetes bacterium]
MHYLKAPIYELKQTTREFRWSDAFVLLTITALLYLGVHFGFHAPEAVRGPNIVLEPSALPYYAFRSVLRMGAAYLLSLMFTLVYGYAAARSRRAEQILLPTLDVLQSVPILSFLPVVLLGLSAVMPERFAAELASVVLIFTSQVWNMTFSWYQSLTTLPKELREAAEIFRMNWWLKIRKLELPFGAIGLIWNSMMSWAGGWFFLMAAEIFTVGERDYRLPGLGAYLREASHQGNIPAILWGLGTLVLVIVLLDQLVWRPLVAWSEKFKLEMVEQETHASSWFYDVLRSSKLSERVSVFWERISERIDAWTLRVWPFQPERISERPQRGDTAWKLFMLVALILIAYSVLRSLHLLAQVEIGQWFAILQGVVTTALRVFTSLAIALCWTVPLGVYIGMNTRLASRLQPLVQIAASIPATALFPVFVLMLAQLPGGLNVAAIMLMLTGTQWYLLFNVIAGTMSIPQELRFTVTLLGLNRWQKWRVLILPALFPYLITGAITASGGAWNASIVAEYVEFGGRTLRVTGLGDLIAYSTAQGNFPLLLASTLTMITTVVLVNRLLWRRLYRIAASRYRME